MDRFRRGRLRDIVLLAISVANNPTIGLQDPDRRVGQQAFRNLNFESYSLLRATTERSVDHLIDVVNRSTLPGSANTPIRTTLLRPAPRLSPRPSRVQPREASPARTMRVTTNAAPLLVLGAGNQAPHQSRLRQPTRFARLTGSPAVTPPATTTTASSAAASGSSARNPIRISQIMGTSNNSHGRVPNIDSILYPNQDMRTRNRSLARDIYRLILVYRDRSANGLHVAAEGTNQPAGPIRRESGSIERSVSQSLRSGRTDEPETGSANAPRVPPRPNLSSESAIRELAADLDAGTRLHDLSDSGNLGVADMLLASLRQTQSNMAQERGALAGWIAADLDASLSLNLHDANARLFPGAPRQAHNNRAQERSAHIRARAPISEFDDMAVDLSELD
ncbi:hypothetical protein GGI21_005114 [Coemansia aciculifera]|nr:hypothetical protein GGI21_005114 [Coemansia aciculifera]